MINNQDGTFTWQDGDIITAEKMNKLLSEDDCGIILLEQKPDTDGYNIQASYNDIKNWIENQKKMVFTTNYFDDFKQGNTNEAYWHLIYSLYYSNDDNEFIVTFNDGYSSFRASTPTQFLKGGSR